MLIKTTNLKMIYQLDCQCFKQPYAWQSYVTASPDCEYYLIEDETHQTIGFITLLKVGNDYELIKIGVLPSFQHQGWGFKSLQSLLADLSFHSMFLEVNENNIPAIKLYQKLHFEVIYTRKHYYQDEDAYIMRYDKKNTPHH